MGELIGSLVDEWTVSRRIGEGAMGAVYEATKQDAAGNTVRAALKVALPQTLSPEAMERFRREAEILTRLQSPHVVRCLSAGESPDFVYLALEYLDGGSLGTLLRERGQLTIPQAVGVMRRVLKGLAAVHAEGVVHRDVKPDNVLLDARGRPRLADFSMARAKKHKKITRPGTILGTVDYMSPEQVEGESIDRRADLYAAGAMLYHLVSGKPPYEGRSALAVLRQHQSADVPRLSETAPTAVVLESIVLTLMAKDPELRPPDAEAALALFEGLPEKPLKSGGSFTPEAFAPLGEAGSRVSRLADVLALLAIAVAIAQAVDAHLLNRGQDLLAAQPASVLEVRRALGHHPWALWAAALLAVAWRLWARRNPGD